MSDDDIVRHISPGEAVHRAMYGEISILELEGERVAVLPASSPWINGLQTALKEGDQ